MYDDTHVGWSYNDFIAATIDGPYAGTFHYSTTVGSAAQFTFDGSQITLYFSKYSNYGNLAVSIDNNPVTTLNQFNATRIWQDSWTSGYLGSGEHTVSLVHAGPNGSTVDIDAIEVKQYLILQKAILADPHGNIGTINPTYTWNEVEGSSWYYLWVEGPSGTVLKKWYSAAQANCNGTTCSVENATPNLPAGAYSWWIGTWNAGGEGPWSDAMSFSLAPPGQVTLISPQGTTTNNPTYRWNEVKGSTWYYLWVEGPSGTVLQKWYSAVQANCNGTTCSMDNITPDLPAGAYSWWIQTWNDAGYGPWSTRMDFTVPVTALPGQATLTDPHGGIWTNNPIYTWNEVGGSSWYYLWVEGPSGTVLKKWYSAVQANCDGTTCSVENATPLLANGSYTWWIRTWNVRGYGPWSDTMSFSLAPPAQATLTSPQGNGTNNPTYRWNEVGGSTWYYLWVEGPSGTVLQKWYSAAQANCNGTTCSMDNITPDLPAGAYSWWIQTWSDAGYGSWSTRMDFTAPVSALPGQATLTDPHGSIGTNNPIYRWNEVGGSTWYYLWVEGPSGTVLKKWYSAVQANCNGTTCSMANVTPDLPAGAYSWWIQTWSGAGYGPWSTRMDFTTPIPALSGKAILTDPHSGIGTNNPTYTWDEVEGSTWYYLWVEGPSGTVFKKWYSAVQANCNGTTCSVENATPLLANGSYTWWIRTWNVSGEGPWSDAMSFSLAPPGQAILTSPQGNGATNPIYRWNEVEGSSWYYLWVEGPSGTVLKKWYSAAQANCNGTNCFVKNATPDLPGGAYSWWIQTWNDAGYGPWSTRMDFMAPIPTLPGQATLTDPHSSVWTNNPIYTWNEVEGSTWYYLWVEGPSGTVFKKWYSAAQANCDGTTCSVENATPLLANGSYTWWIRTWNVRGGGPWSDAMSFSLAPPAQATLTSPQGNGTNNPTYTWNEVRGSSWYYLWVEGPSGTVFKKWYSAAQANCDGTTCSIANVTPDLPAGAYSWWIQTWNDAGYGPWSTRMDFTGSP
jgi:hypothetical protein